MSDPTTGPGPTIAERAIALVERGWSQRRVARHLGIGKTTVHDYVAGEYGGPGLAEQKEIAKRLELARLDRVIRRLDRALRSPDDETAVKAGAALIKASESRRKLLGVDAPTKVEQRTGPIQPSDDPKAVRDKLRAALAEVEKQIAGEEVRH